MINSEILQGLVAREFYVIEPCELKVELYELLSNTFKVCMYHVSDGKLMRVLQYWIMSLDEIDNIALVMEYNHYASLHSYLSWRDACNQAKRIKNQRELKDVKDHD